MRAFDVDLTPVALSDEEVAGGEGNGMMREPVAVAVDNGYIYVAEAANRCFTVFRTPEP